MSRLRTPQALAVLKIKLALSFVVIPLLFLAIGELYIAFYHPAVPNEFGTQIAKAFSPLPYLLYLVFASAFVVVIFRFLKPLFKFILDGTGEEKARVATLNIPWFYMIMNIAFWTLGVFVFYIIGKWQLPVPFFWTLILKYASGLTATLYSVFLVNRFLFDYKLLLNITDIRPGENDIFYRNKNSIINFANLFFLAAHLSYFVFINYIRKDYFDSMEGMSVRLLTVAVFFFAVCYGLYYVSTLEYKRQIGILKSKLDELSEGREADLTKRVILTHFDEIGDIVHRVNLFSQKLQENFLKIRTISAQIDSHSHTVSQSSHVVNGNVNEQAESTEEIFATMEEFTSTMESIDQHLTNQSEIMAQTNESIRRLSEAVRNITENSRSANRKASESLTVAETGIGKVNVSIERSKKFMENIRGISGKIQNAGEQTRHIDDILETIEAIAESTSILSMNASIEAAHAGEMGKGFSIVATEIRNLAERTSHSVMDIETLIYTIKNSVNEAVKLSEAGEKDWLESETINRDASGSLKAIVENIEISNKLMHEIGQITQEQEQMVTDVTLNTEKLNQISDSIRVAIIEQSKGANQIMENIQNIVRSSEENVDSTEELSALAEKMELQGKELSGIVEQFKL